MTASTGQHWATRRERGSFILMRLTAGAVRWLGRRPLTPVIYLIVLYFYVTGHDARRCIRDYQSRLAAWSGQAGLRPTAGSVFKQFMAYGDSLLDRLDAWQGRLPLARLRIDDPDRLRAAIGHTPRGQLLVVSHLGNPDVCRAIAELDEGMPLNVLVHTQHVAAFNRLQRQAGDRHTRVIQVTALDAATMLDLSRRIERGEWLAIAGDRVPLDGSKQAEVDFMAAPALLPQGPWLLALLLRCRVNLMTCLKIDGDYRIVLESFMDIAEVPRHRRTELIQTQAQRYADRLAELCLLAPEQWFNFYPYWLPSPTAAADRAAPAPSRQGPDRL